MPDQAHSQYNQFQLPNLAGTNLFNAFDFNGNPLVDPGSTNPIQPNLGQTWSGSPGWNTMPLANYNFNVPFQPGLTQNDSFYQNQQDDQPDVEGNDDFYASEKTESSDAVGLAGIHFEGSTDSLAPQNQVGILSKPATTLHKGPSTPSILNTQAKPTSPAPTSKDESTKLAAELREKLLASKRARSATPLPPTAPNKFNGDRPIPSTPHEKTGGLNAIASQRAKDSKMNTISSAVVAASNQPVDKLSQNPSSLPRSLSANADIEGLIDAGKLKPPPNAVANGVSTASQSTNGVAPKSSAIVTSSRSQRGSLGSSESGEIRSDQEPTSHISGQDQGNNAGDTGVTGVRNGAEKISTVDAAEQSQIPCRQDPVNAAKPTRVLPTSGQVTLPQSATRRPSTQPNSTPSDVPLARRIDQAQKPTNRSPSPRGARKRCRNCDAVGHFSKDCPQPRDWAKVRCTTCDQLGHTSKSKRCIQAETYDGDVTGDVNCKTNSFESATANLGNNAGGANVATRVASNTSRMDIDLNAQRSDGRNNPDKRGDKHQGNSLLSPRPDAEVPNDRNEREPRILGERTEVHKARPAESSRFSSQPQAVSTNGGTPSRQLAIVPSKPTLNESIDWNATQVGQLVSNEGLGASSDNSSVYGLSQAQHEQLHKLGLDSNSESLRDLADFLDYHKFHVEGYREASVARHRRRKALMAEIHALDREGHDHLHSMLAQSLAPQETTEPPPSVRRENVAGSFETPSAKPMPPPLTLPKKPGDGSTNAVNSRDITNGATSAILSAPHTLGDSTPRDPLRFSASSTKRQHLEEEVEHGPSRKVARIDSDLRPYDRSQQVSPRTSRSDHIVLERRHPSDYRPANHDFRGRSRSPNDRRRSLSPYRRTSDSGYLSRRDSWTNMSIRGLGRSNPRVDERRQNPADQRCRNCDGIGHFTNDCPDKRRESRSYYPASREFDRDERAYPSRTNHPYANGGFRGRSRGGRTSYQNNKPRFGSSSYRSSPAPHVAASRGSEHLDLTAGGQSRSESSGLDLP